MTELSKTQRAWAGQVRRALDELQARGAPPDTPLVELDAYDHEQFCLVVEGLQALGQDVPREALDRVNGKRPCFVCGGAGCWLCGEGEL